MTFDDGILTVCEAGNRAEDGKKPDIKLHKKEQYYYGIEALGYGRYYAAMNAQQKIDTVVSVPGWGDVTGGDVCILEDGKQYTVQLAQCVVDDNGLKITRLTLERRKEEYGIAEDIPD